MGLIPGSGKSPREGNGNPLQYSCLGNPMDKESGGLQSMGSPEVQYNLVTKQLCIMNVINIKQSKNRLKNRRVGTITQHAKHFKMPLAV